MAKIKQALKKITDSFSEFVLQHDNAVEKSHVEYEYTIEQAKMKSYEMRRHTF